MRRCGGWLLAFIITAAPVAFADDANPASSELPAPTPALAPAPTDTPTPPPAPKPAPWSIAVDPDSFALVSAAPGLSLHKPMYLLPATYSGRYPGRSSEVLFAISLKLRLFDYPVYAAYSQKSYFQAYNGKDSKPFRENDFNPELFYRFQPKDPASWFYLAADAGLEHESNGKSLPDSRSWNRIYVAPYWQYKDSLIYWKFWYRIPEDQSRPVTDPKRDDNPDIQDYYGYTELQIQQHLWGKHQISGTFRLNPTTGRGSAGLTYTVPGPGNNFFWTFYAFQGYGESLQDYDRSVTRVGVGISLTR